MVFLCITLTQPPVDGKESFNDRYAPALDRGHCGTGHRVFAGVLFDVVHRRPDRQIKKRANARYGKRGLHLPA